MSSHKRNKKDIFSLKHFFLISLFFACLIFFRSYALADNTNINSFYLTSDQNNNSILFPTYLGYVSLRISILDIDLMKKEADIYIRAELDNFPFKASSIKFQVFGGSVSPAYIQLSHVYDNHYYQDYGRKKWHLYGTGDSYPFDSYRLEFLIGSFIDYKIGEKDLFMYRSEDWPEGSSKSFFKISVDEDAAFITANEEVLNREWKNYAGKIPVCCYEQEGFVIEIERKSLVPFLEFILPIEVCYYLLGTSMFIDRKKPADRLRVYVSLFIFSSTFIFSIHKFLPPRSFLSLPEFLLINLIISSGIIAVFSLIPVKSDRHGKLLDNISLLISSIIFFSIYYLAYRDIIGKTYSIFITSLIGLYFSKIVNRIFYVATLIRARA